MERILFKAKKINCQDKVIGSIITIDEHKSVIIANCKNPITKEGIGYWYINAPAYEVETKSISLFTGLKDKNGVEIFENDKFGYEKHYGYNFESFIGEIKYQDGCFGFKVIEGQNYQDFTPFSEIDELQTDFLNHVVVVF